MRRQPNLFSNRSMEVKPDLERAEPRLWVRRLAVWAEPGKLIRDVQLRRGLNIVWSPDPAEDQTSANTEAALGHGSGKTLFCRLLRYCLGENRFAPEGQRDTIAEAFTDGFVGAEVVLLGTPWAILRSLGSRRRHVAVNGGDLDALAGNDVAEGHIDHFRSAVEESIISAALAQLVPGSNVNRGWLSALAWMTRDQECRFDHVLDWRAAAAGSDSPVRDFSRGQTLDVLRMLVEEAPSEEERYRLQSERLAHLRRDQEQEAAHLRWSVRQLTGRLVHALNVDDPVLPELPMLATDLAARAEAVLESSAGADENSLSELRAQEAAARGEAHALETSLAKTDAILSEIDRSLTFLRGERPGASGKLLNADEPVCPVCEVPIDRALAEGCKLSHQLPDLQAARTRIERLDHQINEESTRLETAKHERGVVQSTLLGVRRKWEQLRERLEVAEVRYREHTRTRYEARRAVQDAADLREQFEQLQGVEAEVEALDSQLEIARAGVSEKRADHAALYQRLELHFDAIVRALAGEEAQGRVQLTGNGLELRILWGGDRSTAAIESLKVLAFDLAILCFSMEGQTKLPAFLVHDSPREADLGLSAYHRLFHLVRQLEDLGDPPPFQYIITTTTQPPEALRQEPWLRATLRGGPADERLLRRNL